MIRRTIYGLPFASYAVQNPTGAPARGACVMLHTFFRVSFGRVGLFVGLALLLFVFSPQLYRLGDYTRQTNPFSGQRDVERAFEPTAQELACLHGLNPDSPDSPDSSDKAESNNSSSASIPNIAHFIFFQRLPLDHDGQGDFDFLGYLSVRSAIVSLKPEKVFFHYSYTSKDPSLFPKTGEDPLIENNQWIRRLKQNVELVRHNQPADNSLVHSEHLADTLRLDILLKYGGIYFDVDAFALRPFHDVLLSPHPHDVVLGNEGSNRAGLCNAVMAARPNSNFIRRWRSTYEGADLNKEWNYHSVIVPKKLAQRYPQEVCELAPDGFFWPTWTWRHIQWMHEPIEEGEVQRCERKMAETGGALFDNQLAYHAWSQMARDRFLGRLTPTIVRREETRFNILMRRFLEDDV
ncbi:hypothetical protein HIM_08879 [Hirsutella minnesotensis 3608]|uniref:Alpha 1,4-glycosyltransferase domain-containing protein n=1 Tax=Hirsutella minnesotensis 3608 TaxID=1043627 RepID=A0A0F7ZY26_9HYPO|nr:hypothetical protein HIM_08879 [Hirsutella minnesotensis 3608]